MVEFKFKSFDRFMSISHYFSLHGTFLKIIIEQVGPKVRSKLKPIIFNDIKLPCNVKKVQDLPKKFILSQNFKQQSHSSKMENSQPNPYKLNHFKKNKFTGVTYLDTIRQKAYVIFIAFRMLLLPLWFCKIESYLPDYLPRRIQHSLFIPTDRG